MHASSQGKLREHEVYEPNTESPPYGRAFKGITAVTVAVWSAAPGTSTTAAHDIHVPLMVDGIMLLHM